MNDVTKLLQQATDGDKTAENELLLLVHDELRRMAAAKLARENPGHTLQTTALINEAYLRLLGREPKSAKTKPNDEQSVLGQWDSRAHFFGAAAEAMRRILIDNARRKKRLKRGGDNKQVPLEGIEPVAELDDSIDLDLLDAALAKLEAENSHHATVVKLRYFAGMTIEQVAEVLNVSPATVKRSWVYSKAWLRRELEESN